MPIFPAQYSTLSSKALNITLQKRYNLNGTNCRLLIRNVSDTYIIENDTQRYVFKIYRDAHRKLEEIRGEVELLNSLYAAGTPVSYPINATNGEQILAFNAAEGKRYGVLFSWAEGNVFNQMSDSQLETAGRQMAAMHNITASIKLQHSRKSYSVSSTIVEPLKVIEPAFITLPEEYTYLKTTAEKVIAETDGFDLAEFSYGYCHFDLFPKNFHFSETGEITIFDFDFAGKGLLAFDIVSFYAHFFLDVTYGRITETQGRRSIDIFLNAYRKIRPFTEAEIKGIPALGFAFWVFYLGFQYENFDDWSNIFFGPKFLKDRVALIKKWMETADALLPY